VTEQIIPNGDNVLLQILDQKKTAGGIVIPEKAKHSRDAVYAKVLAVGPGRVTEYGHKVECDYKVGDFVLLPRVAGVVIEHEKMDLRVLRSMEILARVEESRIVMLGHDIKDIRL
jgi:chaperonin GroES